MADDNSGQRIPSTETLMGWADRYGLEHPVTSERLDLSAPMPEDMSDLLEFLRKYGTEK